VTELVTERFIQTSKNSPGNLYWRVPGQRYIRELYLCTFTNKYRYWALGVRVAVFK